MTRTLPFSTHSVLITSFVVPMSVVDTCENALSPKPGTSVVGPFRYCSTVLRAESKLMLLALRSSSMATLSPP
jgi:hypothetical protein